MSENTPSRAVGAPNLPQTSAHAGTTPPAGSSSDNKLQGPAGDEALRFSELLRDAASEPGALLQQILGRGPDGQVLLDLQSALGLDPGALEGVLQQILSGLGLDQDLDLGGGSDDGGSDGQGGPGARDQRHKGGASGGAGAGARSSTGSDSGAAGGGGVGASQGSPSVQATDGPDDVSFKASPPDAGGSIAGASDASTDPPPAGGVGGGGDDEMAQGGGKLPGGASKAQVGGGLKGQCEGGQGTAPPTATVGLAPSQPWRCTSPGLSSVSPGRPTYPNHPYLSPRCCRTCGSAWNPPCSWRKCWEWTPTIWWPPSARLR